MALYAARRRLSIPRAVFSLYFARGVENPINPVV